jgi:hypothetical protein
MYLKIISMNDSSGVVCSERAAILERRLLLGAGLPRVSGASAFGSPIAVELWSLARGQDS